MHRSRRARTASFAVVGALSFISCSSSNGTNQSHSGTGGFATSYGGSPFSTGGYGGGGYSGQLGSGGTNVGTGGGNPLPGGYGGGVVASGGSPFGSGGTPIGAGGSLPGGAGGSLPGGSGGVPIGSGGSLASGGAVAMGGAAGAGGALPPPGNNGPFCLQQGSGDYSMAGPYMVATKSVDLAMQLPANTPTPTTYTIFYPANMEANCPHPVISWGNGTGVTGSDVYGFFNNNAASWGMVVIASDNSNSAGADYLGTGIDYMMAENQDSSSPFYQKLATIAGTSGHSQGAIAATTATQNQYVKAEVQVEGGGLPKAGIAFLALSGTADNIVTTGPPTQSYGAATGPSMLAIYTGADHVTTPTLAGFITGNAGTIQFMRFYTAWFRCFLANDATACAMFEGGANCGVCKDPNWDSIQTKNM